MKLLPRERHRGRCLSVLRKLRQVAFSAKPQPLPPNGWAMEHDPHDTSEMPRPAENPPLPLWRVELGAVSHAGKVRPRNEDHFLVTQVGRFAETLMTNLPLDQRPARSEHVGYVLAVADGMGGMTAGQQASRLAIRTGVDLVLESPKWYFHINEREAHELMDRLCEYFRDIDRRLSEHAFADPQLHGMGTTLTGAYLVGGNLFVVHVGDSRCYLYRSGKLQQITHDHTLAQEMADAGKITQQSAGRHRMRNVLTRYIGGSDGDIQAEVHWLPLESGDRVLLCTDGLNGMVADEEIAIALATHHDPNQACEALLAAALAAGGRDNITAIVAQVSRGE